MTYKDMILQKVVREYEKGLEFYGVLRLKVRTAEVVKMDAIVTVLAEELKDLNARFDVLEMEMRNGKRRNAKKSRSKKSSGSDSSV